MNQKSWPLSANEKNKTQHDNNSPLSQEIPGLFQRHYEHLKMSGMSDDVIRERGYSTAMGATELKEKEFSKSQRRAPGLLIPIHTVNGIQPFHIYRPDNPRKDQKGKEIKYENPSGKGLRIDVPPRCREDLENPNIRLWIPEGVKKADALASCGECAIDLLGVYGFKHKNEFGATTFSADLDYIAWQGREVYIVFDSDVMTKSEVKRALELFTEHLKRKSAVVYQVYLPSGNGKKLGVDDFLLEHSIEDLLSCSVKQEDGVKIQESSPRYSFDNDGYLCRLKEVQGMSVPVRLANFDARIREETINDNGLEISNFYRIEARTKERHLGIVDVTAASFGSMNWTHRLGYDAVIEPGSTTRDFVRHFIQTTSKPKQITTFTHTGWREKEGEWIYLFSGGAIGGKDVNVSLPLELQRYSLPLVPQNEKEAIKTSLSLLDIGKRSITLPLISYTYLVPLTTHLSPQPNFSLFSYGPSGVLKTTLSMLALNHFGDFESVQDLSNFDDTANALERRAFTLKDMLMVVDDFHPSAQRFQAQQRENTAQRLIRSFANRTGRGRLNSDTTEKTRYAPRGMLLMTGEDLISLQSTLARVLIIEISQGDIDKIALSELQLKNIREKSLSHAMSSFIHWIRNFGIENIKAVFNEKFLKYRQDANRLNLHPKLAEQIAFLQFSLSNVLNWLLDKEVIDTDRAKGLRDEGWSIFTGLATKHNERIQGENPTSKFVDIVEALINQGKVRILNRLNTYEFLCGDEKADMIGYFDDAFLYLLPTPLWHAVQKYCFAQGEFLGMSKNTIFNLLARQNTIETRGDQYRHSLRVENHFYKIMKFSREGVFNFLSTMSTERENDI